MLRARAGGRRGAGSRRVGEVVSRTVGAYTARGGGAGGGGGGVGGGGVGLREYVDFWTQLTVDRITEMVSEIVAKLVDMDTAAARAADQRRSRASSVRKEAAYKALVQTLDYIHLFLRVDYHSRMFARARKIWEDKDVNMNSPLAMLRVKKIMSNMAFQQAEPTSHLVTHALVEACTSRFDDFDGSEIMSSPFMFAYTRAFLHQPDLHAGATVYNAMEANLTGVVNCSRRTPLLFTSTMLNLLFVLKELLVLWPAEAGLVPLLEKMAAQIRGSILLWPKPYCTFAQKVLSLISAEIASPGVHLRRRLLAENPHLLPGRSGQGSAPSRKDTEVTVVVDDLTAHGSFLLCTCRCMTRSAERPRADAVELSRRDLLDNVLSLAFMYAPDFDMASLAASVAHLSETQVDDLLLALTAPDTEARPGLSAADQDLPGAAPPWMQSVAEERWEALGRFPLDNLQRNAQRAWNKLPGETNFAHWLEVPECAFDLRSFDAMLEQHRAGPRWEAGKRLLCLGSNQCVQEVLSTFHPSSSARDSGQPKAVYLAPGLCHNDLCAFLASRDAWYRKHVYAPFCASLTLCPGVDEAPSNSRRRRSTSSSDAAELDIDGTVSPLQRIISLLSDYVQTAQETCEIQVFEVQGFADKGSGSQPSDVMPFVCRVEIGLGAAAQMHSNSTSGRDRDRVRSVSTSSVSSSASSASSGFFTSSTQQPFQQMQAQPPLSPTNQQLDFQQQQQAQQQQQLLQAQGAAPGLAPGTPLGGNSLSNANMASPATVGGALGSSPIMSSTQANVMSREPCVWDEALMDKRFTRSSVGPGVTPPIQVSMKGVKLDGTPLSKSKMLPPSEYLSLVLANCPAYASSTPEGMTLAPLPYLSHLAQASPLDPWLHVSWIEQRNSVQQLHDMIRKRDKKSKELDALADALVREHEEFQARSVEIISERDPIYISVDGNMRGPYHRVKIAPSRHSLSVQTFLPVT